MEYVRKILARQGSLKRAGRLRPMRYVDGVGCAYCGRRGIDPKFETRCTVCGGAGGVAVTAPVVTCLFCGGSGCDIGDLSCLGCKGVGVVSVREDAALCGRCDGTGREGVFYCAGCQGQGMS